MKWIKKNEMFYVNILQTQSTFMSVNKKGAIWEMGVAKSFTSFCGNYSLYK